MTQTLTKGRYRARIATSDGDLRAAQHLRHRAFLDQGADPDLLDSDAFDDICQHYLIEAEDTGALVCCFRILHLESGAELPRSYSAQFYDLTRLSRFPGAMVELGRFCIDPDCVDPDPLRVAWAALTRYVDAGNIEMLFGCSSFKGTKTDIYEDAFALLKEDHLAPPDMMPGVKNSQVYRFTDQLGTKEPVRRRALQTIPSLLRTYLLMGGWVSDHAVIDHQMNTLHVFTGLEIRAIPDARKRLLRAAAC